MLIAAELQFAALLWAIHLAQCVLLLYANEAALEIRGRRLSVLPGALTARLAGRTALLLNPLLPTRAVFRLSWSTGGEGGGPLPDLAAAAAPLRPLAPVQAVAGVTILLAWPLCLLISPLLFLPAVALGYTAVIVLLVQVWRRRAQLGIGGRRYALLAFEALACPPCAITLSRKLSLTLPVRLAPESLDTGRLEPEGCRRLLARVTHSLEWYLLAQEPGSAPHERAAATLRRWRTRLGGEPAATSLTPEAR